jgi:hypothetical protein
MNPPDHHWLFVEAINEMNAKNQRILGVIQIIVDFWRVQITCSLSRRLTDIGKKSKKVEWVTKKGNHVLDVRQNNFPYQSMTERAEQL